MIRVVLLFLIQERGPASQVNLCPAIRHIEVGQRALPMTPFSQLPSAQNIPYVKETYFGVTYSDPFQDDEGGRVLSLK